MALFGKPKPKFGNPYLDTQGPPIAGNDPMRKMDPAPGLGMAEAAQGKKPSVLPYLLAGAEDLVARQMGYQPQGVARLNASQAEQQQAAAAAQADQLKRAQDLADWRYKQQWERDNPAPANNDTINDFEWYKNLSPQDREIYHRMKPQYMTVDNGDGTKSIIPIGPNGPVMGGAPGGREPPATLPSDFFGKGGPTQPASGGF